MRKFNKFLLTLIYFFENRALLLLNPYIITKKPKKTMHILHFQGGPTK